MKRIILIIAMALVLRICAVWGLRSELTVDRDGYLAIASNVAAGKGYSSEPTGEPTAYRPPLYPVVLAPAIGMVAPAAGVALVNVAAGGLAVWFTYAAGRRLGLRHGAGLAAGVVAVDPLLLQYSAQPMTEVLSSALVAAFVWAVVWGEDRGSRIDDSRWRIASRAALTGGLFGAAALCRPTMWLAGGLLALWWVLSRSRVEGRESRAGARWEGERGDARRKWLAAACCLAGILLVIGPWAVRNWMVFGRPIVTTTHGGYTLLLANNPVFYRQVVDRPWGTVWSERSLAWWTAAVEAALQNEDPPVEGEVARDRWMYARAREQIACHPRLFLRACWLRFRRFWNVAPLEASAEAIEDAWRRACRTVGWPGGAGAAERVAAGVKWLVAAFYVIVTAAFVLGLFRVRGEWRRWVPAVAIVAAFTAAHLVYWTNTRMRAPVVPLIALVAARGAERRRGAAGAGDRGGSAGQRDREVG